MCNIRYCCIIVIVIAILVVMTIIIHCYYYCYYSSNCYCYCHCYCYSYCYSCCYRYCYSYCYCYYGSAYGQPAGNRPPNHVLYLLKWAGGGDREASLNQNPVTRIWATSGQPAGNQRGTDPRRAAIPYLWPHLASQPEF